MMDGRGSILTLCLLLCACGHAPEPADDVPASDPEFVVSEGADGAKLVFEDIERVVHDESQVGQSGLLRSNQARPDARYVNLDADEIHVGAGGRHRDERVAVAKAYFEYTGCCSSEQGVEIESSFRVVDTQGWPERIQCAALRLRKPYGAFHETAYRTWVRGCGFAHRPVLQQISWEVQCLPRHGC